MLIEFILNKSLPTTYKISDDLQSVLLSTSKNLIPAANDSVNIAYIFKFVMSELKVISSRNLKMHNMINRLSVSS